MAEKLEDILGIGDGLSILLEKKDGNYLTLRSSVYDVSENTVIISAILYKTRIFPLMTDSRITVKYYKKDVGIYEFRCIVTGSLKFEGLRALSVALDSKIKKSQRRNYFRLPIFKEVKVEVLSENSDESVQNTEVLYDISGGGVGILTDTKYKVGQKVNLTIPLSKKYYVIKAEVVRSIQSTKGIKNYSVGFKFIDIDKRIKSEVVSFIFKKQREKMKKG